MRWDVARKLNSRKRGRRVAHEAAVMPRPVSQTDQMATSRVAYRKSFWLERVAR